MTCGSYMSKLENRWIQAAWRGKILKAENIVVIKAGRAME